MARIRLPQGRLPPYAAALLFALAAFLVQFGLRTWIGDRAPFLLFLPGILCFAAAAGRGDALIVLAGGVAYWVFVAERSGVLWMQGSEDLLLLLEYFIVGSVLVAVGGRFRLTTVRARIAEDRLALAQEKTGMGVFELDFQNNTAYVSASLSQLLGQPVFDGPVPLDSWLGRLDPNHIEESRRAIAARVAAGELNYEREQRIEMPDGGVRWILSRVRIELDAAGVLARARGATLDISERKRSDQLLIAARAELEQQLDDLERIRALSQRLVTADAELVSSVRAALELIAQFHGASRVSVSLLAPGTMEFVHSIAVDDAALTVPHGAVEAAQADIMALACESRQVLFGSGREDAASQTPLGRIARALDVGALCVMPMLSREGRILGAMTVFLREATPPSDRVARLTEICLLTTSAFVEREQSRALAAEKDKRFAVALESSTVPFDIIAPVRDEHSRIVDFRFSYVNSAAATMLGSTVEELVGRSVAAALPGVWEQPHLFERCVEVIRGGLPKEFEFESDSPRGHRWYYMIVSKLDDSLAIWFADISERKRQEAVLRDADRRKDEFLATLAHELRNPLAPIRQAALVAHASDTDEARRRWSLEIIERQVRHMAMLLDDLLDVSRISRGSLELRRATTPLEAVINAALETSRPHIETKRHKLSVVLPKRSVGLDVDALRISQVLSNLLTNAAKYCDDGGSITLGAKVHGTDVSFSVTDSGIGLSPEQQGQVFQMFSQAPEARTRSQGGLGIGLALARGLVELHGGSIEVKSAGIGHGACFTVHLPGVCRAVEDPVEGAAPAFAGSVRRGGAPLRILLADDNVDAAQSLAELLRASGHEVHLAYDGIDALAQYRKNTPDIVLLDVGMPGLSGLDVARAIRKHPAGSQATLVAITGWGQERDREDAFSAGFDHHTTKPVDLDRLDALLAEHRHKVQRRNEPNWA